MLISVSLVHCLLYGFSPSLVPPSGHLWVRLDSFLLILTLRVRMVFAHLTRIVGYQLYSVSHYCFTLFGCSCYMYILPVINVFCHVQSLSLLCISRFKFSLRNSCVIKMYFLRGSKEIPMLYRSQKNNVTCHLKVEQYKSIGSFTQECTYCIINLPCFIQR